MFSTEEDKKASEELFQNFPSFDIRVGMDRLDFREGNLTQRHWQINAPDNNKIWRTGVGLTFADAYQNLLTRLEECNGL